MPKGRAVAVNPSRLSFAEALAFLQAKLNLPAKAWDDLLGAAHDRAFVVAGVMVADLLTDLRTAVEKSIADGQSLETFRQNFERIVTDRGWLQDKTKRYRAWRALTIYETNLFTSYAAGRYQQMQDVADARPYWRYRHSDASVIPRPEHLAWDGTILRYDDPWWSVHYPPGGWGCFAAGTEIATPSGWRAIETLRRGDCVIGGSGNIQTVDAPQIRPFDGEIVRITTKQGEVSATPNHRFLTLRGWIRAENLQLGEILVQIAQVSRLNGSIGNVQYSDATGRQFGMARPFHRIQATRTKTFDSRADFREKYINPIGKQAVIMIGLESPFRQELQQQSFARRWARTGVDMRGGVLLVQAPFCLGYLGTDLWAKRRRRGFQLLRAAAHSVIGLFSFPLARMAAFFRLQQRGLAQNLRRLLSAGVVPDPLDTDPLPAIAGDYAEPFHQPHHRAIVAFPAITQVMNREALLDIQDPEGFANGAPLDSFDSLKDFIGWARAHCHLSKIVSIHRQQYTGNVYNLSITEDASYCLRIGVAHNCKCYVETLSDREMKKSGLTVTDAANIPFNGTVTGVDPKTGEEYQLPEGVDRGWDYAPGASVQTPLADLLAAKAVAWPPALKAAVGDFLRASVSAETWAALAKVLGI